MNELNSVQKAALELIIRDVQFFYTYVDLHKNAKNLKINYSCMLNPYVGLFVDGAEQWCGKVGLEVSQFNDEEKEYYAGVRQAHKLFDTSYAEYRSTMERLFQKSDNYFREAAYAKGYLVYTNVGVDIYHGHFCGNTILCSYNFPDFRYDDPNLGRYLRRVNEFGGKLIAELGGFLLPVLHYNQQERINPKDYHFFEYCPLKTDSFDDFCFFSILCNINFVVEFLANYIEGETTSIFKFAYLQYFYLCDLVGDIARTTGVAFDLDDKYHDRKFRNCLAHYGLGQYMSAEDIINDDPLKGLTFKAFGKNYITVKTEVFAMLQHLAKQIADHVLRTQE